MLYSSDYTLLFTSLQLPRDSKGKFLFLLGIDLTLSTRPTASSLIWPAIRSFFCVFFFLVGFFRLSQFLLNYMSVSGEFIFVQKIKKMWVLHVLLLCHISRPFPPSITKLEVAFWIVYTHKHNSMPKHILPSNFASLSSPVLCRDFYFMKCFDSTIFKLSWSKCINCNVDLLPTLYKLIKNV